MWSLFLRKLCWDMISLQSEIGLTQRTSKNEISPQWDTLSNRIPLLRDSLTEGNLILRIRPRLYNPSQFPLWLWLLLLMRDFEKKDTEIKKNSYFAVRKRAYSPKTVLLTENFRGILATEYWPLEYILSKVCYVCYARSIEKRAHEFSKKKEHSAWFTRAKFERTIVPITKKKKSGLEE